MGIVIGIDIGGSITKIVGLLGEKSITPMIVRAADPVASFFGAFGKFIDSNDLVISDIEKVMITGVGASFITKPIYGIKTGRVEEFLANGLGGLYLTGLEKAVIVSMGTGTALVRAENELITHIGGTGIGGGTVIGLCNKLINVRDISIIIKLAQNGNLNNVDLMVGDISKADLPGLPPDTTASNFGKISDVASQSDIALGVLNLVLQSIGMAACFAVRGTDTNNIVLIGSLSSLPQCESVFPQLQNLYKVNFIIPKNSEYATAYGAALAYYRNGKMEEV